MRRRPATADRRPLAILKKLFLATLSVVVTLVCLEAVARWLPIWPDQLSDLHPRLGFAHIPGARGYWVNLVAPLEYRTYIEISDQGLRDRVYPFTKPPATRRILMLGDSLVEGLEVPLEDTLAKRLERELRLDREHVEVINAAHYGYGTDQELLFFRESGRRWQPDVVLLGFTPGNDVENNLAPISIVPKPYFTLSADGGLQLHPLSSGAPPGDAGSHPRNTGADTPPGWRSAFKSSLYEHSKLYRFVTFQVRVRFPRAHDLLRRLGIVRRNVGPAAPARAATLDDADQLRKGLSLTAALLRHLRDDVRASGGELVVVIMPDPSQAGAAPMGSGNADVEGWPSASSAGAVQRRTSRIAREISVACAQAGITVIDVFSAFETLGPSDAERLFHRLDGHLTSEGHAASARVVRKALEQVLAVSADGAAVPPGSDDRSAPDLQ